MKLHYLLLCLLLTTITGVSQNFKYGKVSKEELAEKSNPSYPDADATVLYRDYKVAFTFKQGEGFIQKATVHERIKIYNKDGAEWARKNVITYNDGGNRETFDLKGVTYNLVNGDVEKQKLKNSAVFEERISKYRVNNKFTMPDIRPGSVIEYEYVIESGFSTIDDIELQYTIPINKEIVELKIPEFFVYNIQSNPKASVAFNFETDSREKEVNFRARSGLGSANYGSYNSNNSATRAGTRTYKEIEYSLDESNIPPLKTEPFVDNLRNYQARSIWELAMINDPNGIPENFATSWEAVSKSVFESEAFVNEIKRTNYYEADLATALKDATSPEQKMAIIHNFVKNKVKWNNYVGYFPEKGVKKAYSEGTGNTADINLMLISMLQHAGLTAYPVLVSTKKNGIPVYPTREGFNYVIAAVNHNGSFYILDATDPFSNINMLPERAMNWQGRLIRPDGSSDWVGLYPSYMSKKLTYVQAEIDNDNLTAKVRERKGGHYAKDYRTAYAGSATEVKTKAIDTNSEAVEISEFEAKDVKSLKDNLSLSYTATSNSLVEEIAGDLYVSPMLYFAQTENPFKDSSRTYPIFFEYPKSEKYNITIKIPEGYKVKSLPDAIQANLAGNTGSYTYLVKEAPGVVQLAVSLDINTPIILPQDYEYVKGMFTQITEKEKEKIVFTKI
ncbi:MAG TPA: DUF3857 domain-containing protein [Flavobacteriaceae bacterium]|nr:DUF3857 domain-containing protein [Flavobacteriaceae bacterium]HIO00169.1 DUF3857 domain-containing protein [Flavobacteriaceae bacterium]